jgi:hypothetical protein
MKFLLRSLLFSLALTGTISLLLNLTDIEFGHQNFWDHHGIFFLFFITLFPRLTLLFSSVPFGGFFWWIGFFFAPRILVAILATLNYWHANPVLVLISWLIAISGEIGEKAIVRKRVRVVHFNRFRQRPPTDESKVIEVNYQRID